MSTEKILLVDDDEDVLLVMTLRLMAHGYHVISAMDAASALTTARLEFPDLIILDLGLDLGPPGGNGYSVMAQLKAVPATASIPVIVLTGKDAEGNQERSYQTGAVDFFQKPPNTDWLLTAVERALKERAAANSCLS